MPIEYSYLVASSALLFIYICGEMTAGHMQYSTKELLGARDHFERPAGAFGRAQRSTRNMVEALVMFAPLILIAGQTDSFNQWTSLASVLFFWSRVVYAPLYWFGVPVLRSLVWFVSVGATVLVFFQVLPFSGAA
ncbi:MAG: MAPEG family protein [Pseudomonadota bacterium]